MTTTKIIKDPLFVQCPACERNRVYNYATSRYTSQAICDECATREAFEGAFWDGAAKAWAETQARQKDPQWLARIVMQRVNVQGFKRVCQYEDAHGALQQTWMPHLTPSEWVNAACTKLVGHSCEPKIDF